MKAEIYRLTIYKFFTTSAKNNNLKWLVAHGSEGYPCTIGRDLDILCDGEQQIELAVNLFKEAAKNQPDTKWVIDPHPIWGRRVLAISKNYEVAELHILYKLNSGMLDCSVDWDDVDGQLFPQSQKVSFFKSKLMPLLGGSAKMERFTKQEIEAFPWSLKRLAKKNEGKQPITIIDKLLTYIQVGGFDMMKMYRNYQYAKIQTAGIPKAATTPVILLRKDQIQPITENLDEVFLKFVNGDELSTSKINYQQTRQRLVYLTIERKDIHIDVDLRNESSNFLDVLTEAFSKFNLSRQSAYQDYYKMRLASL